MSCLPTNTFADSNYWLTPLWAYAFTGFNQPVDNGGWNTVKAGGAIPVKFSLGGDQGLDVIKPGFPQATEITSPGSSTLLDSIEQTVPADESSLSYDAAADPYVYIWKTSKSSTGKCHRVEMGLNEDTSRMFDVVFR